MGDTRTDSGQYYPGGRVVARRDVAPPQIIVQWSDVQGKPQIAPLPDKYRDSDVKGKINEIASKFATVVLAALIGWTACADITVQKKRRDQIYNDEQVVVDVTGSGVGVDTNAVRDIVREQLATNGIRSVDGAARPTPKYLHLYECDDSYPADAEWYYAQPQDYGLCSSVRDGGFLCRNYDWKFDDAAEFVVKVSAGPGRFASVGVANCGTNLTEEVVTGGKPSRYYKCLPGRVVDGINENGVACNINVVGGDPQTSGWHNDTGDLHPLAAIRWILDHATNAQHAAEYIALHIAFPPGWTQNFHYMIADEATTFIVENGHSASCDTDLLYKPAMANFAATYKSGTEWRYFAFGGYGPGIERVGALVVTGLGITNVWYTNAYRRETTPPWVTDLAEVIDYTNDIFNAWAAHPKEYFRGKTNNGIPWWQTVHTSIYDITNRTLRVAVQETDDWYTFQVPSSGAKVDAYTKAEADAKLAGKANLNGSADEDFHAYGLYASVEVSADAVKCGLLDSSVDVTIGGLDGEHRLSAKANRPSTFTSGNIAALDENGDLADSGQTLPTGPADNIVAFDPEGRMVNSNYNLNEFAMNDDISATNPTFSNEVAKVAKTVTPTPTGTLRLFDPVLNRWVILKSVNMNITLEVE